MLVENPPKTIRLLPPSLIAMGESQLGYTSLTIRSLKTQACSLIDHFTVVCSVTWPLDGSKAGVNLVLIRMCQKRRPTNKDRRPKTLWSKMKTHWSKTKTHRSKMKTHWSKTKTHRSKTKTHRSKTKTPWSKTKTHRSKTKTHRSFL